METIIVKDVPKSFIKQYGKTISYDFFMKNIQNDNEVIYWNDEEINNMGKTSSVFSNSF